MFATSKQHVWNYIFASIRYIGKKDKKQAKN